LFSYSISGLSVASDMPLPGAIAADGVGERYVRLRRATVPVSLGAVAGRAPLCEIAGDRFLLRIPGIARFLISAGREIAFEIDERIAEADAAVFLGGVAFGILLHQRGQVVLNGSAVAVNGRAVVFCGASGVGKSALAAALVKRGYPMVADDICAVSDGSVHPDVAQLKLWQDAIERLELADARGERVRSRLEKFHVQPAQVCAGAVPLGAVYAMREMRPPDVVGIARCNIVDVALTLRRAAYRPLVVREMEQVPRYLKAVSEIGRTAGIFHLVRSYDFAALDDLAARLEGHWREIGLLEATP